ncbi:MAG: hypothetical protein WC620_01940 [Methanoregula sp.]|jgi:hypothetical protein
MRLAYVALALFIIAQGVSKPVLFYTLIIPVIVFVYGVVAKETLPEVKVDDEEETADGNSD